MSNILLLITFLLTAWNSAIGATISDQTLAEALARQPGAGELIWLESNGRTFLAQGTPARLPERLGGIILVHDYGEHLDSSTVIGPLRRMLAEGRWQTLSLSLWLPTFDHGRPLDQHSFPPYLEQSLPRLSAAIDHLIGQGVNNIVLLGHGTGATVVTHYLDGAIPEGQASHILALIAVGMQTPDFLTERQHPKHFLTQSKLPILDILSSRAAAPALAAAKERQATATQAGNTQYRQLIINGADERLDGAEDTLAPRIKGWLQRHATELKDKKSSEGEKKP